MKKSTKYCNPERLIRNDNVQLEWEDKEGISSRIVNHEKIEVCLSVFLRFLLLWR